MPSYDNEERNEAVWYVCLAPWGRAAELAIFGMSSVPSLLVSEEPLGEAEYKTPTLAGPDPTS